jgi:hypothetical protein
VGRLKRSRYLFSARCREEKIVNGTNAEIIQFTQKTYIFLVAEDCIPNTLSENACFWLKCALILISHLTVVTVEKMKAI